jgi:hypothetical protein
MATSEKPTNYVRHFIRSTTFPSLPFNLGWSPCFWSKQLQKPKVKWSVHKVEKRDNISSYCNLPCHKYGESMRYVCMATHRINDSMLLCNTLYRACHVLMWSLLCCLLSTWLGSYFLFLVFLSLFVPHLPSHSPLAIPQPFSFYSFFSSCHTRTGTLGPIPGLKVEMQLLLLWFSNISPPFWLIIMSHVLKTCRRGLDWWIDLFSTHQS